MDKGDVEQRILEIYRNYLVSNFTYNDGKSCLRSKINLLGQTCVIFEHYQNNPDVAYSENNPTHKVFGCEKNAQGFIIARPWSEFEGLDLVEELLKYRMICFVMEESATSFSSCWSPNPFSIEPTMSLEDEGLLDLIVEAIAPNLSFLKYKRLKSILSATEVYEPEYYSDGTYYKVGLVPVSKLAQYLIESN